MTEERSLARVGDAIHGGTVTLRSLKKATRRCAEKKPSLVRRARQRMQTTTRTHRRDIKHSQRALDDDRSSDDDETAAAKAALTVTDEPAVDDGWTVLEMFSASEDAMPPTKVLSWWRWLLLPVRSR